MIFFAFTGKMLASTLSWLHGQQKLCPWISGLVFEWKLWPTPMTTLNQWILWLKKTFLHFPMLMGHHLTRTRTTCSGPPNLPGSVSSWSSLPVSAFWTQSATRWRVSFVSGTVSFKVICLKFKPIAIVRSLNRKHSKQRRKGIIVRLPFTAFFNYQEFYLRRANLPFRLQPFGTTFGWSHLSRKSRISCHVPYQYLPKSKRWSTPETVDAIHTRSSGLD